MEGGLLNYTHMFTWICLNVVSLLLPWISSPFVKHCGGQAPLSRPAGHEDCRSNAKPGESQLGRGVLDGFGCGIPRVFESKINIRFRFLGIRSNFGQMLLLGTVRMWCGMMRTLLYVLWYGSPIWKLRRKEKWRNLLIVCVDDITLIGLYLFFKNW